MDGKIPVVGRFFKVLVPGFQTSLKLPPAFTRTLNLDVNPRRAVLKSSIGSWRISVKKCSQGQGLLYLFGEGWERYVSDHELKIGDFIVFEHTGHFHFNTLVFDETCCHKNLAASDEDNVQDMDGGEEAANGSSQDVNSQFQTTLRRYHFLGSMNIPAAFGRSNGLRKHGTVTLRNASGDSWQTRLNVYTVNGYRVLLGGFGEFLRGNKLNVGDKCIFQLDHVSQDPTHVVMDVQFVRNVV